MKLRVKVDDQTFEVEVGDLSARPVLATIDGETFSVWPEAAEQAENGLSTAEPVEPAAASAPVKAAAPAAATNGANKGKVVSAPIPGVIISVAVKEGDPVIFGQELCVLEAMKMKNIIRANRPGKVAQICIAAGDQVKHGQPLIEYAE